MAGPEQTERFTAYFHQSIDNVHIISPTDRNDTDFGAAYVVDLAITEGPERDSKVAARAQGTFCGNSRSKRQWYYNLNILFEDERYNGSSLEVRGTWDMNAMEFTWAIVGGTGAFTLAQGIVDGKRLEGGGPGGYTAEITFNVFFRTVELRRALK